MKLRNKQFLYILSMVLGLAVLALAYFLPLLNVEAMGKLNLGKFLTDTAIKGTVGYWLAIAYMVVSFLAFLAGLVGIIELDMKVVKSSRYTSLVNYCLSLLAAVLFAAAVFFTYNYLRTNETFLSTVAFGYGFYIAVSLIFVIVVGMTYFFYQEER